MSKITQFERYNKVIYAKGITDVSMQGIQKLLLSIPNFVKKRSYASNNNEGSD